MAMHKPKKIKRFQPGGLIDTEGRPVRDGSNQPIMTGSFPEEDEITARGRAKNAEMFKSLFNRATGQGKNVQDEAGKVAQMAAAEKKLAQDVQNKLKADKAAKDDADFAEADRVSSTARAVAGKPAAKTTPAAKSGIVTKEELKKSGLSLRDYMNKQQGKTRRGGKPPTTTTSKPATTTSKPAVSSSYRSEGAGKTKPADKPPAPAASNKKPEEPNIVKIAKGLRARGEADLEARGLSTSEKAKPPAQKPEPTAASYSNEGRGRPAAATKKPEPFEMPVSKFFRGLRERGDADLKSRGMAKGGSVSSASKRADGIAQRGKTRGKVY
jgi:hypothetical protein